MGSAKVISTTLPTMDGEKKKCSIFKMLKLSFSKKDKQKEPKEDKQKNAKEQKVKKEQVDPVDRVLDDLEKLKIEKKNEVEEDDESQFFTLKVVKEDTRSERIDSQSSEDSGFSESKAEEDVVESLKNLKIDGDKKKTKTVLIPRQPVRGNVSLTKHNTARDPYPVKQPDSSFRQISQVNKHTLSGGQVLVNASQVPDNYAEVDIALKSIKEISQKRQKEKEYLDEVLEYIKDDIKPINQAEDFLSDFVQIQAECCDPIQIVPTETPEPNPVEEFSNAVHINYEDIVDMNHILMRALEEDKQFKPHTFPTPPRSENVPSPMSGSPASFYPTNSEYTLSPERSSPIYNSDYEKYQDLAGYEEYNTNEVEKPRDRVSSVSSMTMKQFKDLQKDIANSYSKMECCDTNRRSCKELFQEHLSKLKMVERKNLCIKVAKLDLRTAYGVLQNILLSLSRGAEQEHLQFSLFALICERILAQVPALFAKDFGLYLLKSAALRCPRRPLLTRYLVQCIRVSLRIDSSITAGKDSVFQEVDAQGDSLVIACVRAGDAYADVLSEIVRNETDQPPLFKIHHANTDGYTALHVCCSQHSARSPRLHTAHVLLQHAAADVWKGDVKGGDTAVHLAVNSANCDLQLIMMLFKNVDRRMWKSLAHCRNMSSVTPLEYARSAAKSTTRQNYPQEVLDFLKKCR